MHFIKMMSIFENWSPAVFGGIVIVVVLPGYLCLRFAKYKRIFGRFPVETKTKKILFK